MTKTMKRFDASEYLDDAGSQAELLNEALKSGEAGVIVHALGTIARARGMTELSRASGVGRSSLYRAIEDDANPTLATLLKLLSALDMELKASAKEAA